MFCRNCGAEISDNAVFCPNCGCTVKRSSSSTSSIDLILAIFSTLCCCIPLGIVSIIYACKVSPLERAGDIEGAKNASKKARMWAIIAIVLGLFWGICYFLLMLPASANGGY